VQGLWAKGALPPDRVCAGELTGDCDWICVAVKYCHEVVSGFWICRAGLPSPPVGKR
jgi:hypothetical protein